ncbi:MAG: hypothetical protein ACLQFI_22090 [Methylocella sp.]
MRVNPFFELYVGDRLSSSEFVNIFSPFLVKHAEALFLPGNVVVKGVQGSGKSMLLSLLKPDVRMEYARAGAEFPVRRPLRNFIGAGINLAHSNAIDFGYRSISENPNETALFFADFVNYKILLDLFETLKALFQFNVEELNIRLSTDLERDYVAALASDDIFQGFLDGCTTLADISQLIASRLNAYRRFLHLNDSQIDAHIRETKTDIGGPISAAVALLKAVDIIDKDIPVFIHIDQYEELANISSSEIYSPDYRRVINRALARRDPAVSYRIGTRGHAWRNHGFIFGADAKLEEERDYKFVDLDEILRRNENRKTWVFPEFVEDVFERRLKHVDFASAQTNGRQLLERVFGRELPASEKAKRYGGRNKSRSVKIDRDWPPTFQTDIRTLSETDPLSARLLEAWVLQQLAHPSRTRKTLKAADLSMAMLPDMQKKVWWIKERIELALVQIAGRCAQRPLWSGVDELIELSGGNVLTFLSICQFIWDTRNQIGKQKSLRNVLTEIDVEIQAIGVFKASHYWLSKITQETGRSGDRFRLARQIGNSLHRELYVDRLMSYPGHNGFSLADEELERFPHVKALIEEMSDYGTLIVLPHTTKEKDRRSRQKVYLNPVLCPQFRIPYKRLKEPKYIHPTQVEAWMDEAGLEMPPSFRRKVVQEDQPVLPLFGGGDS